MAGWNTNAIICVGNNCLKRQKAPTVKTQGTEGSQFDCPTAVKQKLMWISNIKLYIKNIEAFAYIVDT